jgi:hypothetical protein
MAGSRFFHRNFRGSMAGLCAPQLSKGRVVAAGRPDELATRAGVREAYFG